MVVKMSKNSVDDDERVPMTCADCDLGFTLYPERDACDFCGSTHWEEEPCWSRDTDTK